MRVKDCVMIGASILVFIWGGQMLSNVILIKRDLVKIQALLKSYEIDAVVMDEGEIYENYFPATKAVDNVGA